MVYKKKRELEMKLYNLKAALSTLDDDDKKDFNAEIEKVEEKLRKLNSSSDHKSDN